MKTAQELGQDLLDAVELTERWKALGGSRDASFAKHPREHSVLIWAEDGSRMGVRGAGPSFLEAARNAVAQTEDRGKLL